VVIDRIGVRENVTILNFAHLKFSTSVLGSGSFSKVYKGAFKGNLVAIKSIYTIDLTAEVIDKLATEAKILTAVQNPNVVIIYGKLCWLIDSLVM
jgi:predicted Ser/Thr protein kinase